VSSCGGRKAGVLIASDSPSHQQLGMTARALVGSPPTGTPRFAKDVRVNGWTEPGAACAHRSGVERIHPVIFTSLDEYGSELCAWPLSYWLVGTHGQAPHRSVVARRVYRRSRRNGECSGRATSFGNWGGRYHVRRTTSPIPRQRRNLLFERSSALDEHVFTPSRVPLRTLSPA
jgi:hypothetical protein